jgi:hypothetical protein
MAQVRTALTVVGGILFAFGLMTALVIEVPISESTAYIPKADPKAGMNLLAALPTPGALRTIGIGMAIVGGTLLFCAAILLGFELRAEDETNA